MKAKYINGVSIVPTKFSENFVDIRVCGFPDSVSSIVYYLKLWLVEKEGFYKVRTKFNKSSSVCLVRITKQRHHESRRDY